jgi:formate hydrogenlyase subunit 3/multisubunit Na+/H+ antiporter MnhD subunit
VAFYRRASSWEAAFKYLLVNGLGLAAGLLGLGFLCAAAGGQGWSLSGLATAPLNPRLAAIAGALILAGFGTKGALMPLHFWLPDAYQESPGGFSALFAGAGTKVALLALARLFPPLAAAVPALRTVLIVVACITMLVGVALTFAQDDMRRLLAYSSVSQMGYIALGIGAGGAAGMAAAAYHMAAHGTLKALLFLCVAWLWQYHGTVSMAALHGRQHPGWLGPTFLAGALALGGMPPLPAFWSKFAIFLAAVDTGHPWAAGAAVLTSLLTITTLVWAGSRVFLQKGGDHSWEKAA